MVSVIRHSYLSRLPAIRPRAVLRFNLRQTRLNSSGSAPPPPPGAKAIKNSRLEALNNRLPTSLRRLTTPLLSAPVSHVTSFLILHEITAILPLVGLASVFHWTNWLPDDWAKSETLEQGVKKWGRYLRRKGWIQEEEQAEAEAEMPSSHGLSTGERMDISKPGVKLLLEVATAYALVKMALPLRIAASVGLTPWFARTVVIPVTKVIRRS